MKPLKRRKRAVEAATKDSEPDLHNDENGNDVADEPKANPCKLCKQAFDSMDELVMHAKIEHTPRKHKTFSAEDIEYFLKVFSKLKRSHCPICHKAILNTLNWRGHMYRHCVAKKVLCRICGKSFTRTDHCKNHEVRHTIKIEEDSDGESSDK